jgi:hypothetical protein
VVNPELEDVVTGRYPTPRYRQGGEYDNIPYSFFTFFSKHVSFSYFAEIIVRETSSGRLLNEANRPHTHGSQLGIPLRRLGWMSSIIKDTGHAPQIKIISSPLGRSQVSLSVILPVYIRLLFPVGYLDVAY